MTGGEISKNPIFTGALGMYNNVILHESTRVPTVVAGAYRAILCGAQAATLAFGQDSAGNKVSWVEELFDYGNQLGVAAGMIWGGKKMVFNSQDFGVITVITSGQAGTT
jgi:N4-gp56 family major capsid protein